jgi:hypothetical protein
LTSRRAASALHDSQPQHRELVQRSLGEPEHYNTLRSRVDSATVARELGVPVPLTRSIASAEVPAAPRRPGSQDPSRLERTQSIWRDTRNFA